MKIFKVKTYREFRFSTSFPDTVIIYLEEGNKFLDTEVYSLEEYYNSNRNSKRSRIGIFSLQRPVLPKIDLLLNYLKIV